MTAVSEPDSAEFERAIAEASKDGVYVMEGEHSTIVTNMEPGGWVKQKDGSYVSEEYAKTLNRAQRRKLGIKL